MKKKESGKSATNPFVRNPNAINTPAIIRKYHRKQRIYLSRKYTEKRIKIVIVFSNILFPTAQYTTGVNNQKKMIIQLIGYFGKTSFQILWITTAVNK